MKNFVRSDIAAMHAYQPGEQTRDQRVIKLNTNENPYPLPQEFFNNVFSKIDPQDLSLYPDPTCQELKKRIAQHMQTDPEFILVGNGSDDILTILVRTFLDQNHGMDVITPNYSLYPILAKIQGCRCQEWPMDHNFQFDPQMLRQAQGQLLFVSNPQAPLGTCLSLEILRSMIKHYPGLCVIDEAYVDFADQDASCLLQESERVILVRTLSKSFSLAGARLGWAIGHPCWIEQMIKVKDSYNVNALSQKLALAALDQWPLVQHNIAQIRQTRQNLIEQLQKLDFTVLASQTNFVLARPLWIEAHILYEWLKQRGVLVRYFANSVVDQWVRITVGTDEQVRHLLNLVAECRQDNLKSNHEQQ